MEKLRPRKVAQDLGLDIWRELLLGIQEVFLEEVVICTESCEMARV